MSNMKLALTYDDIQLVPKYSEVLHRSDIKLHTLVSKRYGLLMPLVASPMDTVCEEEMAFSMFLNGGVGCIHRFMSIEEQSKQIRNLRYRIYGDGFGGPYEDWGIMLDDWHSEIKEIPIIAAIGVKDEDKKRAKKLVESGANILLIDVAHGHHINVINMIKWCKDNLDPKVDIIAGNIATSDAAYDLETAGADGLRIGIGGGSLCTTRIKTGFGVPNVTSLNNICSIANVPVIADGGIRNSGDIAKALALGSSSVMLGSLLAGTEQSPGKIIENLDGSLSKKYRGSASLDVKTSHNMTERNVEGESTIIPYKGGVRFIINGLLDGVKSAFSYNGSDSLDNFNPEIIQVTNSGILEAKPHLLK
jgi:IMP dehydrogenase